MEWDNLDVFADCQDSAPKSRPSMKGFGNSRRSSALFHPDKRVKCDASEVALTAESPLAKPKQVSDDFEGFSIVRNRVPSVANSPFSKSEELLRNMLPRPRSSSSGRFYSSNIPSSPHEFHTPKAYPDDAERLMQQVKALKDDLAERDSLIAQLQTELAAATSAKNAAQEDANATKFMCAIQEQRIEELEQQASRERLDRNEALSEKSRKHKAVIKKLNQDRAAYEERADMMIKQMNEQMTQLQQMAMSRIEVSSRSRLSLCTLKLTLFLYFILSQTLENELMAQRHSNDKLQAECTRLHACAAAAMASATKHRQLAAAFKSASPASARKALFSASGTLRSAEKRGHHEGRSSTGTSSSYASTQVRDDDGEVEDVEEEDVDGAEGSEDDEAGDENESQSNTPVASPSVDKLSKVRSPTAGRHFPVGEEELWAQVI